MSAVLSSIVIGGMHRSIRGNDLDTFSQGLSCLKSSGHTWIDCVDEVSGDTLLHVCAQEGNLRMMRILLDKVQEDLEVNLETTNKKGRTCLQEAALYSRRRIVAYLLDKGAQVNSFGKTNWTALMFSCSKVGKEAAQTVEMLLRSGASTQPGAPSGWTPLHVAAREGDVHIISLLLSYGADVAAVSSSNRTVLHIAAFRGHTKAMERLLACKNAPINHKDTSKINPAFAAIRAGNAASCPRLSVVDDALGLMGTMDMMMKLEPYPMVLDDNDDVVVSLSGNDVEELKKLMHVMKIDLN